MIIGPKQELPGAGFKTNLHWEKTIDLKLL